jgi:hypothetical protein
MIMYCATLCKKEASSIVTIVIIVNRERETGAHECHTQPLHREGMDDVGRMSVEGEVAMEGDWLSSFDSIVG